MKTALNKVQEALNRRKCQMNKTGFVLASQQLHEVVEEVNFYTICTLSKKPNHTYV
jgi:hypothetical protein